MAAWARSFTGLSRHSTAPFSTSSFSCSKVSRGCKLGRILRVCANLLRKRVCCSLCRARMIWPAICATFAIWWSYRKSLGGVEETFDLRACPLAYARGYREHGITGNTGLPATRDYREHRTLAPRV